MSTAIAVQEGQVVTSYEKFDAISWCTPSVLGCKACISATASGGTVSLTVSLQTPLGNWSQTFSINANRCFTFQPVSKVKIDLCIGDFSVQAKQICFTLSAKVCFDAPFIGWKCTPQVGHQFCVPLPGHGAHALLSSGDDLHLATLLLLNESAEKAGGKTCNCH